MYLLTRNKWHPSLLVLYGFLAAAGIITLYCIGPLAVDAQTRMFRGLLGLYGGFLGAAALIFHDARQEKADIHEEILARIVKSGGSETIQKGSRERTWLVMAGSLTAFSFFVPPYALSKHVFGWAAFGWPDLVGPTCSMFIGLVFLCDLFFLARAPRKASDEG